jgi:RNase P subunit RPR2
MECKKCKTELIIGKNIPKGRFNNGDYRCKECASAYAKEHRLKNQSTYSNRVKKWYIDNKEISNKRSKELYNDSKDGFYYVYHIADSNYVGITGNLSWRKMRHKQQGRDLNKGTGFQILYKAKNRNEALEVEAKLHALGFNG